MSDEMVEIFRAMKEMDRARKSRNLTKHLADPRHEEWTKHTDLHWSRKINGKQLDFWPSRNKFRYEGKVHTGDVYGFIKNRTKDDAQ